MEHPAPRKKILIAENEPNASLQLEASLERLGYEVCGCVNSGNTAINKANECRPDLILMDIMLRGPMDGIETAKTIKKTLDIPILYLTAVTDSSPITRARETDPYGYIQKPVNILHLYSMIDTTLNRRNLEMHLRKSEEKYRNLVEDINDVIFALDENGLITFVASSAENQSGYIEHDLIGHSFLAIVHPEDRDKIAHQFSTRKQGFDGSYEGRILTKSGKPLWVRVSGKPMFVDGVFKGIRGVLSDIDEKKRAEEALRVSEERFRSIATNLPGVVLQLIIGENNKIGVKYVSQRCFELFGMEREPLQTFFERGLGNIRPVHRELWMRTITSAMQNKIPFDLEGTYWNPRGFEMWLRAVAQPMLKDGELIYNGIVFDITDRKRAEEQLKLSEERNRLLVENANEGIVLIQDWKFIFTNPRFISLTGFDAKELSARRFTEFVHPDDREMIAGRYLQRLKEATSSLMYEVRFINKDGAIKWTEVNSVMLIWEQRPSALLFIRDIGERKRAGEERAKLDAQIQQTQKLESLGVMAGGIAHDFNNLLMAILGNIDLALLNMTPSSSPWDTLTEAAKVCHRAADLCKQMLAYSGRGRFTIEPLNLNDIVKDMAHMLEVSVSKKAFLRYHLDSGIPTIEADATQLRQIIMNLVINSSDAIGPTNGVISLSTGVMSCDRAYLSETWLNENLSEGTYAFIEVADTGCGMDSKELPKIFDPFFTTKFTGRGLGLAAVLGIVRGHHGAIKVHSEKEKGTTFKIFFPALERRAQRVTSQETKEDWRGSGAVLLVDDEEQIRVVGKRMLEYLGFVVLTAQNGREAVDIFNENSGRIRCVILDLTMPQMDGEEAFLELRRIKNDIPIIMSSGYSEQEITERLLGKGLDGFIHKPYEIPELAAKLEKVLG